MFALIVFSLIASSVLSSPVKPVMYYQSYQYVDWSMVKTDLTNMIHQLISNHFKLQFPTVASSGGVESGRYVLKLMLPGFEEKEIVVQGRDGMVKVTALHKSGDGVTYKNYEEFLPLPSNVSGVGSWTYDGQLLTIYFSMKPIQPPITRAAAMTTPRYSNDPDIRK